MYQRFRDSIIAPARIVEFRQDKIGWVILYILFFALLLSTRMIIDTVTYDGLRVAQANALFDNLPELDASCVIDDAGLSCDTAETTLLLEDPLIGYYLETHDTLQYDAYASRYNVVIHQDMVRFLFNETLLHEVELTSIDTDALPLDFAWQTSDPERFEAAVLLLVDGFILAYKDVWAPVLIAIDFLTGFLLFLSFVLVSAMMMRLRFAEVPYRQMFTMNAYAATTLYLILIFNSLFQLGFFLVILLIFVAFRQNNQLSFEILRRLKERHKQD
jgi:membrane-associated HD superfamily phosphohydrolase